MQKVQQVNKAFKILSSFQSYLLSILKKYNSINDDKKYFLIHAKYNSLSLSWSSYPKSNPYGFNMSALKFAQTYFWVRMQRT